MLPETSNFDWSDRLKRSSSVLALLAGTAEKTPAGIAGCVNAFLATDIGSHQRNRFGVAAPFEFGAQAGFIDIAALQ